MLFYSLETAVFTSEFWITSLGKKRDYEPLEIFQISSPSNLSLIFSVAVKPCHVLYIVVLHGETSDGKCNGVVRIKISDKNSIRKSTEIAARFLLCVM